MRPLCFDLYSYPGLSDQGVSVQFTLPQGTWTSVLVFNQFGEEISTLLEGEYLQAGTYTFPVKLTQVSSGSYTVRVQTGLGARVTRIAVVR